MDSNLNRVYTALSTVAVVIGPDRVEELKRLMDLSPLCEDEDNSYYDNAFDIQSHLYSIADADIFRIREIRRKLNDACNDAITSRSCFAERLKRNLEVKVKDLHEEPDIIEFPDGTMLPSSYGGEQSFAIIDGNVVNDFVFEGETPDAIFPRMGIISADDPGAFREYVSKFDRETQYLRDIVSMIDEYLSANSGKSFLSIKNLDSDFKFAPIIDDVYSQFNGIIKDEVTKADLLIALNLKGPVLDAIRPNKNKPAAEIIACIQHNCFMKKDDAEGWANKVCKLLGISNYTNYHASFSNDKNKYKRNDDVINKYQTFINDISSYKLE